MLACNKHDICYQTCGSDRGGCDAALSSDASQECLYQYPLVYPGHLSVAERVEYGNERARCLLDVKIMYGVVLSAFGGTAYERRQVEHCMCCQN